VNVNEKCEQTGKTPLHLAIENCDNFDVQKIIEEGADVISKHVYNTNTVTSLNEKNMFSV